MNINNICNEYQKVLYVDTLKKEIDKSFQALIFNGVDLSDYKIVILQRYTKDKEGWERDEIYNQDAIKGFILNGLNVFVERFRLSQMYDGYNYKTFKNEFVASLFDNQYHDVFLSIIQSFKDGKLNNIVE